MDGIASVSTPTYFSPTTTSAPSTDAPATTAVDSISLSGADASNLANIYSAPDPAFAALLQSDAALAQDYADASQNQFGFDDPVLASDDTLPAAGQPSTASSPTATTDSVTVDQKVALGALTFEGSVTSALFGASSSADANSIVFMGSSMNSLLTANGTAALAYLTPQAAAAGASVNASA
jgi:hypothetical protein